jgi:hypothetical protein
MRAAAAYLDGGCELLQSLPGFGCELRPTPSVSSATSRSGLLWPATTTTSGGGSQAASKGAREATTRAGWGRGMGCCWSDCHYCLLSFPQAGRFAHGGGETAGVSLREETHSIGASTRAPIPRGHPTPSVPSPAGVKGAPTPWLLQFSCPLHHGRRRRCCNPAPPRLRPRLPGSITATRASPLQGPAAELKPDGISPHDAPGWR